MTEAGAHIGMMCGFAATLAFADLAESVRWRVVVAAGLVLPLAMIVVAVGVLSESPRYLVTVGRDEDACDVLKGIYPPGYKMDLVVADIREALERERLAEHNVGWSVIFHPTPAFRRMLLLGWGVSFAQQAIGVDAIQYYVLDVIHQAGITSTATQALYLLGMAIIKLQCIILCGRMLDVQGRRFVLFLSLTGMFPQYLWSHFGKQPSFGARFSHFLLRSPSQE